MAPKTNLPSWLTTENQQIDYVGKLVERKIGGKPADIGFHETQGASSLTFDVVTDMGWHFIVQLRFSAPDHISFDKARSQLGPIVPKIYEWFDYGLNQVGIFVGKWG